MDVISFFCRGRFGRLGLGMGKGFYYTFFCVVWILNFVNVLFGLKKFKL